MSEPPDTDRGSVNLRLPTSKGMSIADVQAWFVREVLPLEPILMQYLQHNWRNKSELGDLRQEVYVRVCEAAQKEVPEKTKAFVLTTARNLLINRTKRARVVPIESAADVDALGIAMDEPGADRVVIAREELRRLTIALDRLPPRCREAIVLGRIEGLSRREIAQRMGIAEDTVRQHLIHGMRVLTDLLHNDSHDPGRLS
jgi:RNA polymerase sigma-70 factor (ECF subfamily)